MRSLPICRAFLNPFASNCRGSSTLGFVRLVTVSDWRRPRNVGVRQDDVRVSVRAVDMLAFFVGFRWFPAIGARGSPQSTLRASLRLCLAGGQAQVLCSGGPKSYVLELRLASVGSERTAVVWYVLPAVLSRVREQLCHRDAQLVWASSMSGCSQHSPQLIAEASPTTTAALIRRQNPPA